MKYKLKLKGKLVLVLSLCLCLSLIIALSGCAPVVEPEPPVPVDTNPHPVGAVAMLVNLPTEEERSEYTIIDTLDLQETDESIIFVAIEDGTSVEVVEIAMQDNGNLIDLETVYSVIDAPKDFAMELKAFRPEGAPYFKLVINLNDIETVYYISYNGKDGNPKIEYIF